MKKFVMFLTVCAAACLLIACVDANERSDSGESSGISEETSVAYSKEETASSPSVILLYNESITATAEKDGFFYRYTYCFDISHKVFNAEVQIIFPDEEHAIDEYRQLLKKQYPNLVRDGKSLAFIFPRKECPYYGIRFDVLPYLLENTIYEITEICPAEPETSDGSEEFDS